LARIYVSGFRESFAAVLEEASTIFSDDKPFDWAVLSDKFDKCMSQTPSAVDAAIRDIGNEEARRDIFFSI
jgi:hypothetical protein